LSAAAVIVDWGTSAFRAWRFPGDGTRETRASASGILSVADGAFEAALRREIGDWLVPGADVLLSGMITSRNGWIETPYAPVPATLEDLAGGTVLHALADGVRLRLLPGVAQREPRPDIMRGEEIQVFGTVGAGEDALVILPGTHSKWVAVEGGRIVRFQTMMTGEVYAVLKDHSILGRLIPAGGEARPDAFRDGVMTALGGDTRGLLSDLFAARSGVILGMREAAMIADHLSGLLLGHEIREGLAVFGRDRVPVIVGNPALASRYREALALAGMASAAGPDDATVRGFARLAQGRNV
jgi:2-dehydro-3-deoxygalactonokinase